MSEEERMLAVKRYVEAQKLPGEASPIRPIPVRKGTQLYNHQVKAYNIALALFGYLPGENDVSQSSGACGYFLDMGLGKGLCTIAATGRLFLDGRIGRVLIVAPSSVCAVWPHEYQKFAGFPYRMAVLLGERSKRIAALKRLEMPMLHGPEPLQLVVVNYESVRLLEEELEIFDADLIVCDESQRIKNHSAKQSKAMHRLGDRARYKMILTGTPITQDTRDVWSQYRFLDQHILGRSYYTFLKRYAIMGGYGQHQYLGARNQAELIEKVHSIAYRAMKSECLDLPEKLYEERIVTLEPEARRTYQRMQKESYLALENGGEVTANIVLTRLLRLQQITGGFITDDDGKTRQISTAKLDAVGDIVQSLCIEEGEKLVIFARFRVEIEAIRDKVDELLRPAGLSQVAIWGDVPVAKRGQIVEQFQTDPSVRVLVGQIEACAEGITLHAAHVTMYYSLSWNFAKYQQSQDRTHRIGQDQGKLYIHLVVPGSIDTKIMAALKRKEDIAHSVVDNWRSLLAGEDVPDE